MMLMFNEVLAFTAIGLLIYLTIGKKWIFSIRQRWFAWIMNSITEPINKGMQHYKSNLFKGLEQIVSADPELRKNKKIRVLEIGAGGGANFKYLPAGTQLIAVDINDKFRSKLMANLKSFPEIHLERYVLTDAANMQAEIPDNSVDAVIAQYCLCSCQNKEGVLNEVLRVLVPGASFYFLEHVLDKEKTFRRPFQKFIQVTGIWPFFGCGCNVAQDTASYLRKASFSNLEIKEFYLETKHHWALHFIKPTIAGIATK